MVIIETQIFLNLNNKISVSISFQWILAWGTAVTGLKSLLFFVITLYHFKVLYDKTTWKLSLRAVVDVMVEITKRCNKVMTEERKIQSDQMRIKPHLCVYVNNSVASHGTYTIVGIYTCFLLFVWLIAPQNAKCVLQSTSTWVVTCLGRLSWFMPLRRCNYARRIHTGPTLLLVFTLVKLSELLWKMWRWRCTWANNTWKWATLL